MKHSQTFDLDGTPVERSDMELVQLTRFGDKGAFGELWTRHYNAALRTARAISFKHDPEDLVQEAFTRIYHVIHQDRGPKEVFRPYLYSVLRSVSMNWSRNENFDVSLEEIPESADESAYSFEDQALSGSITARAFTTLNSQWRAVLWYMDVEGMSPREVAPILGLNANATSALAYRAREALRSAWLQAHLNSDNADTKCKWIVERLGAYNRATLSARDKTKVQDHLVTCLKCSTLLEEVEQISKNLGLFLLPVFLGPHVFSYLDTIGQGNLAAVSVPPNPIARHLTSSSKLALGVLASAVTASGLIAASIFIFSPVTPPTSTAMPKPVISAPPKKTQPNMAATAAPTASGTPTEAAAGPTDLGLAKTTQRLSETLSVADLGITTDFPPELILIRDTQPRTATPSAPAVLPTVPVIPAPSTPAADAPIAPSPSGTPAPTASPTPSPTRPPAPSPTPVTPPTQPPVTTPEPSTPSTPDPTPRPTQPASPEVLVAPTMDSITEQGLFLPLVHGAGVPGATITVLSAGQPVGTALVAENGAWSTVPDVTLASSSSVSFRAYQSLDGLVSAKTSASAPIRLSIPEVLSIQYTNGVGNVSLSGPADSTVEVIIDGTPTGNLHLMNGSAAVRRLPELSPGKHTLTVRFVDQEARVHGAGLSVEFDVPHIKRQAPQVTTDPQEPA